MVQRTTSGRLPGALVRYQLEELLDEGIEDGSSDIFRVSSSDGSQSVRVNSGKNRPFSRQEPG